MVESTMFESVKKIAQKCHVHFWKKKFQNYNTVKC